MIPQLIGELICSGLCHVLFAGLAGGDSAMKNAQKPPTKLSTPAPSGNRSKRLTESRDTLRNCSFDGCNALSFRSTDRCWRHQDEPPSDPEPESEPEPEAEANWWEGQQE
ncbi:uncharacterized protein METZ01_LOCUS409038 [marine metagenome]|uniref:Uncharacterized protein n=1 Tax=marine metagenome TaxID=408172 RepID=A0A382WC35_9ZZZZ